MMWLSSHRFSLPALCAAVAVLVGTGAGMATVNGLHQRSYGPSSSASLFADDGSTAEVSYADEGSYGGYSDARQGACDQCSERDRGYRWAVLATVRYPEQCPNDSWGFRRGCLDFVGGS